MKKHYGNRSLKLYPDPKVLRRGGFVLLASLTLLSLTLLQLDFADAGPWPLFNIKDYEAAGATWAGRCFPEESVRRTQYVGCPGNKVGHHAVSVYMTGGYIMKFDIRDERISDEMVEVVVDSVVCQKGPKKMACPCDSVLLDAKEVKNKKKRER
jgi:hypothetical protein